MVGLGHHLDAVTVPCLVRATDIVVDHLQGTVSRGSVDNEVGDEGIVLREYAVEGALQDGGGIVSDSDIGDGHSL